MRLQSLIGRSIIEVQIRGMEADRDIDQDVPRERTARLNREERTLGQSRPGLAGRHTSSGDRWRRATTRRRQPELTRRWRPANPGKQPVSGPSDGARCVSVPSRHPRARHLLLNSPRTASNRASVPFGHTMPPYLHLSDHPWVLAAEEFAS